MKLTMPKANSSQPGYSLIRCKDSIVLVYGAQSDVLNMSHYETHQFFRKAKANVSWSQTSSASLYQVINSTGKGTHNSQVVMQFFHRLT